MAALVAAVAAVLATLALLLTVYRTGYWRGYDDRRRDERMG